VLYDTVYLSTVADVSEGLLLLFSWHKHLKNGTVSF
jgi:hypothetical protein